MDVELQKYYENRLDMCASDAWRDLVEDVMEMIKATNSIRNVDEKTLGYKKGELSMMDWLVGLKDSSSSAYEALKNEGIV